MRAELVSNGKLTYLFHSNTQKIITRFMRESIHVTAGR